MVSPGRLCRPRHCPGVPAAGTCRTAHQSLIENAAELARDPAPICWPAYPSLIRCWSSAAQGRWLRPYRALRCAVWPPRPGAVTPVWVPNSLPIYSPRSVASTQRSPQMQPTMSSNARQPTILTPLWCRQCARCLGRSETATLAAVQRLRTACVTHLDTRIAQPLEAPIDWRRDDTLGCRCRDCQALGAYLRDASQQVWVFAAAEITPSPSGGND